ncbi:MAG: MFS transporter [Bryobacteraceae bacterium]
MRAPRDPAWLLIGFLWVCYALNHADRQVVYTLFPALQKEFGYSNQVLGLTGALFLWIYGLCSPVAGVLGDRWPRPKLVVGSLAIWSFFTVLSGISPNGMFLLACRALLGVSESMFFPAAAALIAAAHGPESRSKAMAIFATSQMAGVATGGSLSGFVAEHFHWRASFWILGAFGIAFAVPLWLFLSRLPEKIRQGESSGAMSAAGFLSLFRIPTLLVVTTFVAIATFALFLVYTWLPTFLGDKFHLGMSRAGFEASVYPQIGTLSGLFVGGSLADHFYPKRHSARYWIVLVAFVSAGPFLYMVGAAPTLAITRVAVMGFGFFAGFVSANQVAAAYDVVPRALRASTIGLLNFLGAGMSGFAPYLGGWARDTVGVDRLMAFTAGLYGVGAVVLVYGILRHFERDHAAAQETA